MSNTSNSKIRYEVATIFVYLAIALWFWYNGKTGVVGDVLLGFNLTGAVLACFLYWFSKNAPYSRLREFTIKNPRDHVLSYSVATCDILVVGGAALWVGDIVLTLSILLAYTTTAISFKSLNKAKNLIKMKEETNL